MPFYVYICNNCSFQYEEYLSMEEVRYYSSKCPECRSKRVRRDFQAEGVGGIDLTPKTVGGLADRNADKMSDDQKAAIQKESFSYLENRPNETRNPRPRKKR